MNERFQSSSESAEPGHEKRDINAGAVVWFALGLALSVALIALGLRGWMNRLDKQTAGAATPTAAKRTLPPEPRLQTNSTADLGRFRDQENTVLNSYEWINRTAGIVRIPIEQAMDLLAQRGLPATKDTPGKTRLEMRQERANLEKPLR